MKKIGQMLLAVGLFLLLGAIAIGVSYFFMASTFRSGRVAFLGAAICVLAGLLLFVAGRALVNRACWILASSRRYCGRTMQYQLALHFKGAALPDHDAMIELQRQLTGELGASATVAGHDMGTGETTIFIHTSDAGSTFERCKPVLARLKAFAGVTAAYRLLDGDDYQVLWPPQFEGSFALA